METPWRQPIVLKSGPSREVIRIGSPRDALIILACRWPEPDQESFLVAMQVCSEALGRPEAAERARDAVIAALQGAGFPVDDDGSVQFPSGVVPPSTLNLI
jgi:hypothetical protein